MPVVTAPCEAEAQCCELAIKNKDYTNTDRKTAWEVGTREHFHIDDVASPRIFWASALFRGFCVSRVETLAHWKSS